MSDYQNCYGMGKKLIYPKFYHSHLHEIALKEFHKRNILCFIRMSAIIPKNQDLKKMYLSLTRKNVR